MIFKSLMSDTSHAETLCAGLFWISIRYWHSWWKKVPFELLPL